MESEEGAKVELHVNGGLEKKAQEGVGLPPPSAADKENENVDNGGAEVCQENGAKGGADEVGEGFVKASDAVAEDGPAVAVPTGSVHAKRTGGGTLVHAKKSGVQKGEMGKKGSTGDARKQRSNLSKSLTLPPKGILAAGSRKSVAEVRSAKAESGGGRANGTQNALVTNGKASTTQSKLASVNKSRHLTGTDAKIGEIHGGSSAKTPDVRGSVKTPSQLKADDDARSTTSVPSGATALRRSTGSTFAFRLDERAQKRKQFFMKLEEKIQAIEVEKTNQQEKSKEDREAEIKQLRKSLTFKATPMPSFYKEPAPPKAELKKIPTTRPKSPKLGRRKPSATNSVAASECKVPDGGLYPGHIPSIKSSISSTVGVSAAPKNPIRKSVAKLPKAPAPKTEAKSLDVKDSEPTIKGPEALVEGADIPNNNLSENNLPESTATDFDKVPAGNAAAESKAAVESSETMTAREDISVNG